MEHSVIFQNTGTQRHIPEHWNTTSYSGTMEHSVIFQNTGTHCFISEHWNTVSYFRTLEFPNTPV
jgi:hypothetical protein